MTDKKGLTAALQDVQEQLAECREVERVALERSASMRTQRDEAERERDELRAAIDEHRRQSQYDEYERGDAFAPELTIRRDRALYALDTQAREGES